MVTASQLRQATQSSQLRQTQLAQPKSQQITVANPAYQENVQKYDNKIDYLSQQLEQAKETLKIDKSLGADARVRGLQRQISTLKQFKDAGYDYNAVKSYASQLGQSVESSYGRTFYQPRVIEQIITQEVESPFQPNYQLTSPVPQTPEYTQPSQGVLKRAKTFVKSIGPAIQYGQPLETGAKYKPPKGDYVEYNINTGVATLQKGGTTQKITKKIVNSPYEGYQVTSQKSLYFNLPETQTTNEVYNPKTRTYQRATYGYGAGGTATSRSPTYQERLKIQSAQDKGDIGKLLTGVSTREYNQLLQTREEIQRVSISLSNQYAQLEDATNRFEQKYGNLIKDGKFVGTPEQYNSYQEEYKKLNELYSGYNNGVSKLNSKLTKFKSLGGEVSGKSLELPKVKLGDLNIRGKTILKGKKVPLEKFKGLYSQTGNAFIDVPRQVGSAFDIGASQIFFAGGEAFGKAVGEKREFTLIKSKELPSQTLTVYEPQFGTKQVNQITGEVITGYKQIEIPARTRQEISFTGAELGESVGEVATFGAKGSKYLIPYAGTPLFATEVAGEIKEGGGFVRYAQENPLGVALTGTVVLGGVVGGVTKELRTLGTKQVSQQLLRLGESPIRYIEFVDRGTNQATLRGLQETGRLRRQIDITGRLAKTEKGFEFIPSATGTSITTGQIKQLGKTKQYFGLDIFETGSKGTSIPYRTIGDVKQYKSVGLSTYVPRASTFTLFEEGAKFKDVKSQLRENIKLRGDVAKDIFLGDVFRLKENIFLNVKRDRELGLTFVKRATEPDKSFIVQPANVKKTPFSVTFAEEFGTKPSLNLKTIQKGITKQSLPPSRTKVLEEVKPVQVVTQKQEPIQLPSTIQPQKQEVSGLQKVWEEQGLGVGSGLKQALEQETRQRERQIGIVKPSESIISKEVQKERQGLKEILKLRQQTKQTEAQLQKTFQKNLLKGKSPLKEVFPKIVPPTNLFARVKNIMKETPQKFEAIGFRFGKEKKLGTFGTQSEAESTLSKFLKGTLGASGFLTAGGKKIKAKELNLLGEGEFRVSKRSPFVIVEKKQKRLRKGTTGKEIQYFKKKKKSKSIFGI